MISIFAFLLLASALMVQLTHASASPLDHSHRAVYRRTDASDDEWEFDGIPIVLDEDLDDYIDRIEFQYDALPTQLEFQDDFTLKRGQDQIVQQLDLYDQIALEDLENPFDHSDDESIHFPDRKRRKIITESDALNGLKTTGLDHADASNEDNSRSLSKLGDNDDKSNAQSDERGNNLQT